MERFTCRTCLSVVDIDKSFQIFERRFYPKSIKDILLQYVPQMEDSLSRKDRICKNCLNTVKSFVEFVDKCIEIENHLKNEQVVIENIEYEEASDDEDAEGVDNIQIILDQGLKPYFSKDGDSCSMPSPESVTHDHAYIKSPDNSKSIKNEVEYIEQEDMSDEYTDQDENSLDGTRNIKLIPVATDDVLGEVFMEVCDSQEDDSLRSNVTVLATGDEIDPDMLEVKEEPNESSAGGAKSLDSYEQLGEESSIYICELCGDGFLNEELLKEHYLLHGEIRLMCDKCPKVFKNESALKAHYKLKHLEVERYKCDICGQLFGRADYLRNHVKRHEEDKNKDNVKCRVPGKFLRFKNTDDPLPCKICGKYYNGIQKLKVHLQTHLVVKRFACEYCDLTYKRWPSLKRHEKTHLEAGSAFHRCNVCWKRFYTKEELDFHMSQHGNPRYRCQVCDEQFHRKYLFDNHYLLKHATPEDIENSKKEVIYDTLLELSNQNLLVTE